MHVTQILGMRPAVRIIDGNETNTVGPELSSGFADCSLGSVFRVDTKKGRK